MTIVSIALRQLERPEIVLAGRLEGRRTLIQFLERLPQGEHRLVALNFEGIELATSSFLSEAVLRLRDHLRLNNPPCCLVVVNLNERVEEELDDLLKRSGQALGAAKLVGGELAYGRLLGELDAKLAETLRLVRARGEATGAQLHAQQAKVDAIGATAWNNRLSSLAAMGLLTETQDGRAKRYRLVMEFPAWA